MDRQPIGVGRRGERDLAGGGARPPGIDGASSERVVDREIAERWGALNVPDPRPAIDGLLAATALVHDLTLVTRNGKDVASTGVRLFDPFA